MIPLDYSTAHYTFESAEEPGPFYVVSFEGFEEISRLFQFQLHLVSPRPDVDFARVVNKPATFTMMRRIMPGFVTVPVPIHGLVIDFEQSGATEDYVIYRAVLAPRLWRFSLNYQNRIFQNTSVPDIIREVLTRSEYVPFTSDDVRFDLNKGTYLPREYCVQYQETDLDFICRLMEFEGICFFFEHKDGHDRLVISDETCTPKEIAEGRVRYTRGGGLDPDAEAIERFVYREKIVTGKVILKDYDYEEPDAHLEVDEQLNSKMPGVYYEYGPHYKHKEGKRSERLARVRNEEIECERRVFNGQGDCAGFQCGYQFSLYHHYRKDLDGKYLITRVEHRGTERQAMGLLGVDEVEEPENVPTYLNLFICIPADVQYRPPRLTPEPRIPGVMTARIEKAGGPYADLDADGRYHARMYFDRRTQSDQPAATATKPIRMVQPYSGPEYGIHFPNHADTEMIWACVDGNVDRPIALGTVPNKTQTSPSLAKNDTQNRIKTWNDNELTFDDKKGEELIYMHATKDQHVEVMNDRTKDIYRDEKGTIMRDRTTDVIRHETLTVQKGNRTVTVASGHDTHTIQLNRTATVVKGDDALTVKKGRKTDDIEGPYEIEVFEDHFQVICGRSRITLRKNGKIEIIGTEIEMRASGPITINGKIVDIN